MIADASWTYSLLSGLTMRVSRLLTRLLLAIIFIAYHVDSEECLDSWEECRENESRVNLESRVVCCSDPAHVADLRHFPDGTINCTCVGKMKHKYDEALEAWAQRTDTEGRMCQHEEACHGAEGNSSINHRFTFCCRKQPSHTMITVYNSNNIEYIGCRCNGHAIPADQEGAYVVPETGFYTSSGETCKYNEMCEDHPNLLCSSPLATFCCYGSRGLQLRNHDNVTQCTCTHEIFGTQCIEDVIPVPGSNIPCMAECDDKEETEKCVSEHEERCCPAHMKVNATLARGTFTDCTCSMDLQTKRCHDIDYWHNRHKSAAVNVMSSLSAVALAFWLSISLL